MSLQGNLINLMSDRGSDGDIIPSDATDQPYRGLYIGTGGDVSVEKFNNGKGGVSQIFKAVPAGTFMPIHVLKIKATGTTAQNILGL